MVITIAIIVGVITLAGGGYFVYKNLSEQPVATVEQNENIDADELLDNMKADNQSEKSADKFREEDMSSNASLDGVFQDADAIHKGSGTATVTETADGPVIVFSKDFKVTPGPDLLVYLSPNEAASPLGEFVSLGKLKSNSGSQAYNLPDNYKDFKSVTVWCRAFSVKFTYANLE